MNVFSAEGRKQDLAGKINEGLPVRVEENDELPKNICELCVQQVLQISEYRQKCCNTDTMFRGCLGSPKLKNEGRVSETAPWTTDCYLLMPVLYRSTSRMNPRGLAQEAVSRPRT